jgi:hypothetical protein
MGRPSSRSDEHHHRVHIPTLYPILDAGVLRQADIPIEDFARELREAGISFLQYRDKESQYD